MGFDTIITMCAQENPYYFEQTVSSIEGAINSKKYLILVSVDGVSLNRQKEILNITKDSKLNFDVITQNKKLGNTQNTWFILKEGFKRANKVIHLEENLLISKCFFLYMEQMLDYFENNSEIFSISGFSFHKFPRKKMIDKIEYIKKFVPFGWATWKNRFEEIQEWFGVDVDHLKLNIDDLPEGEDFLKIINKSNTGSWVIPMDKYHRKNRYSVSPYVSKSKSLNYVNIDLVHLWANNINIPEKEIEGITYVKK